MGSRISGSGGRSLDKRLAAAPGSQAPAPNFATLTTAKSSLRLPPDPQGPHLHAELIVKLADGSLVRGRGHDCIAVGACCLCEFPFQTELDRFEAVLFA
jgi:hypothetical protein